MHTNGVLPCTSCELKLEGVHETLVSWFEWVKKNHPLAHVCWGYRNQKDQHADFMEGRSKLDWPCSLHNHDLDGQPCSLALDIFTLDDSGKAHFDPNFYEQINLETISAGYHIKWGGTFVTLKDLDHFQLII